MIGKSYFYSLFNPPPPNAGHFITERSDADYYSRNGSLFQSYWECGSVVLGAPFTRIGSMAPSHTKTAGVIVPAYEKQVGLPCVSASNGGEVKGEGYVDLTFTWLSNARGRDESGLPLMMELHNRNV